MVCAIRPLLSTNNMVCNGLCHDSWKLKHDVSSLLTRCAASHLVHTSAKRIVHQQEAGEEGVHVADCEIDIAVQTRRTFLR